MFFGDSRLPARLRTTSSYDLTRPSALSKDEKDEKHEQKKTIQVLVKADPVEMFISTRRADIQVSTIITMMGSFWYQRVRS